MWRFPIIVLSLAFLIGCSDNEVAGPEKKSYFTLIVWLAGDNDLSEDVPRKLGSIAQGFSCAESSGCRLLVYSDTKQAPPSMSEIMPDGSVRQIKSFPEQNSASQEVFGNVLAEMIDYAPAERYGLILFSHATGWLPPGMLNDPRCGGADTRSIFTDGQEEMPLEEFIRSLPQNVVFDYMVFENCYMAGVEVAYALRNNTGLIVASCAEILSPGFDPVYRSSFDKLIGENTDLCGFAEDYYLRRISMSGDSRSATISVINTAYLQDLATLASSVIASSRTSSGELPADMQRFNRNIYPLFFDLEEYLCLLAPERSAEIRETISRAIPYQGATPEFMPGYDYGFQIRRHCGLTVYIPRGEFPWLDREYFHTAWWQAVGF